MLDFNPTEGTAFVAGGFVSTKVFAIVLQEANTHVHLNIQEKFQDFYRYTDTFYLVLSDALADEVAQQAGIKGDGRVDNASGFVIRLNKFSYAGHTLRTLWEWLEELEQTSQ